MIQENTVLNANPIVTFLQKPATSFTKADIINYIVSNEIRMVNFMYPGGDGKLKTLNFVINDLDYLDTILTCGERVDGSSLFSFIQAGSSDLYVLPRVAFTEVTGMEFQAMGELEYYVISDDEEDFPAQDQRGYHESAPYAKANEFRTRCMQYIAQAGGKIKYGHSEVGNFSLDGKNYEQNEIEFLPVPVEQAADQLMLAKWIIRNLFWSAYPYAYAQGWQEPDALQWCALRGCPQDDCRYDGPGTSHHCLWQQESHQLFPSGTPSGGSHQCVLGRQKPQRTGTSAPWLGC